MKKYNLQDAPRVTFTPINSHNIKSNVCVELMSDVALQRDMMKAVAIENYEAAIIYRDELFRRKNESNG